MKRLTMLLALVPALAFAAEPAKDAKPAAKDAKAAPAAGGKTEVTWYGHAAFTIKTPGGTVLAVDPWIKNPANKQADALDKLTRVDFILVSHGHSDHVGDAIALQKKSNAKFVGAFELGHALVGAGAPADSATMMTMGNPGGTIQLNDEVSVAIVPAVHSAGFMKDEKAPMEYAGNPVGFVIQIKGGPSIYHSGDTDVFNDMALVAQRFHPDIALACIGGHFTMDARAAGIAARLLGVKTIIPMHFGTFPILTGKPEELAAALKAEKAKAQMVVLNVGETKAF